MYCRYIDRCVVRVSRSLVLNEPHGHGGRSGRQACVVRRPYGRVESDQFFLQLRPKRLVHSILAAALLRANVRSEILTGPCWCWLPTAGLVNKLKLHYASVLYFEISVWVCIQRSLCYVVKLESSAKRFRFGYLIVDWLDVIYLGISTSQRRYSAIWWSECVL